MLVHLTCSDSDTFLDTCFAACSSSAPGEGLSAQAEGEGCYLPNTQWLIFLTVV